MYRTRLAEPRDTEATRAIYNVEVASSTVTFDLVPRTAAEQLAWIEEHSGGHPAIVAVDGDQTVVGFGSLSPYRPRPAYAPTVEDSVYVRRDRRGAGVGKLLMDGLYQIAVQRGCSRVEWTTDTSNQAAQAFYESLGTKPLATKIFYRASDIS